MNDAIELLLCIIGGALIGGALGYRRAESRSIRALDGARAELETERDEHSDTRADRSRWKRLANKLHDENAELRAFFDPLFKVKEN